MHYFVEHNQRYLKGLPQTLTIMPKDISICSVVEEMPAKSTILPVNLSNFVFFQCGTQESITQPGRVLPQYLMCLEALFTGFHMLYYLCR